MSDLFDDDTVARMGHDALAILNDETVSEVYRDLACSVMALIQEREKMTAAFHAARAHPDYLYTVTPIYTGPLAPVFMSGWEPNPEYRGEHEACWRKACWRKRKEPT